jgi:hypothetical protein
MLGDVDHNRRQMAEVAAKQYGLLSSDQLRALGFSDEQRRHLLRSGVLRRLRRSVYAMAGVPQCWEQAVLAAVLAAGPGAVLSHGTAGAVWQLKHCGRAEQAAPGVHVTAERQLRMAGVRGHRRRLEASSRRVRLALPVTSPEQTIADLAGTLTDAQLGECIDDALRRGLLRLDRLRRLVAGLAGPGRRQVVPLRRALADRGAGYDPGGSDWERVMDRTWRRLGLPEAVRQYRVKVNGRSYRLDVALPDLMIGVEWNGFESDGTCAAFDRDSDRRADLTAAGWHMLDFTARSSPERIASAVLAAVRRRQAMIGLAA